MLLSFVIMGLTVPVTGGIFEVCFNDNFQPRSGQTILELCDLLTLWRTTNRCSSWQLAHDELCFGLSSESKRRWAKARRLIYLFSIRNTVYNMLLRQTKHLGLDKKVFVPIYQILNDFLSLGQSRPIIFVSSERCSFTEHRDICTAHSSEQRWWSLRPTYTLICG